MWILVLKWKTTDIVTTLFIAIFLKGNVSTHDPYSRNVLDKRFTCCIPIHIVRVDNRNTTFPCCVNKSVLFCCLNKALVELYFLIVSHTRLLKGQTRGTDVRLLALWTSSRRYTIVYEHGASLHGGCNFMGSINDKNKIRYIQINWTLNIVKKPTCQRSSWTNVKAKSGAYWRF